MDTVKEPLELCIPNSKALRATLAYIRELLVDDNKAVSDACDVLLDALYGLNFGKAAGATIRRFAESVVGSVVMTTPTPTIKAFLAERDAVCEVLFPPYRKPINIYDDLRKQARRMGVWGNVIRVRMNCGRIYMLRTDKKEEQR